LPFKCNLQRYIEAERTAAVAAEVGGAVQAECNLPIAGKRLVSAATLNRECDILVFQHLLSRSGLVPRRQGCGGG
jgi:hypothetical protein